MSDLFDQLKSAGPIKNKDEAPTKPSSSTSSNKHDKNVEKFNAAHKSSKSSNSGNRRESMPPPATTNILKKNKGHKARSLSPPKFGVENVIKSLKVKLERKKLEQFLSRPLDEHANNIRVKHAKQPKKMTPTKAAQKLFEPSMGGGQKKSKTQMLRDFNVKPCKVRIHRDNLQKLLREFGSKKSKSKKPTKDSKTSSQKRPATSSSGSPPAKKGKFSSSSSATKNKSNFFIKLNTSPSSKLEKKLKNLPKSSTAVAHHNKIRNSKSTPTTPTKFSRSQLIRSFGERFFNVHVKIERCTHPLMLTFESNDRARRLQVKRNTKSKNLSVSFREQVEIFGGSSSDSDDSFDDDFCAVPNRTPRKSSSKSTPAATPVVMPARLKKVENGKVIDDIELDPSLFVDPNNLVASTPFSPGRKKRDHKSYSPLKDECTPSPRKEQLKLANEKIPPSGFRRLNIDEDDDEDDDCEYIVPIEMPQRRTSRTSSNTTLDGPASTSVPLAESTAIAVAVLADEIEDLTEETTNNIADNIDLTEEDSNIIVDKSNKIANNQPENISDESFQSANDVITENNKVASVTVTDSEKLPAFTNLQTPPLELSQALVMAEDEDDNPMENDHNSPPKNGVCDGDANEHNVDFNNSSKQMNTMDDLSMNLFMDDSQSNENDNHTKSFVDSLINETIDKLTKDIDESASDEQFAN